MHKTIWTGTTLAAAGLLGFASAAPVRAADNDHRSFGGIEHVLLISIDGFHATDLANCTSSGLCPNLERLTDHGTTYANASTTKPSDSFPGTLAPLTGGTPKTTGVFYDDSYDRKFFAPGSNCKGAPGTE